MARNVVTHQTLLFVRSFGDTDFSSDPEFDGVNFTQGALNNGSFPVAAIPLNHNKIVGGAFIEMSQAEKNAVDEQAVAKALVAVMIMSGEETVNSSGWTTVGTAVIDVRRYGDPTDMRVEALGMADTSNGAADIRIAWFDGTGNGAFGITSHDTSGSMVIVAHNRAPADIPMKSAEYRLQARKGAATNITMRGWVLTFIEK